MPHLAGGYYLSVQFSVSFGKRFPEMLPYALFLIPLAAVFALRMIAMGHTPTRPGPTRRSQPLEPLPMSLFVRLTGNGASNVVRFPFRPRVNAQRYSHREAHNGAETLR
jgi:hypothetical protein